MNNRRIVIGVTGGIAAFKTAALVSQLVQAGAEVQVVMTATATRFVGPLTFAALTGRSVACDGLDEHAFPQGAHITLARQAQLLCVAPATANILAKAAHGIADDLMSTMLLSFEGPVLLAPAMNPDMWNKPSVQRNIQQLEQDGFLLLPPDDGWLSCGRVGKGRMADPELIFKEIDLQLADL